MSLGVAFWVRAAALLSFLLVLILASRDHDEVASAEPEEDLLYALSFWR